MTATVTTVNAVIPENQLDFGFDSSRSLTSVSSCGICGKEDISVVHYALRATTERYASAFKAGQD